MIGLPTINSNKSPVKEPRKAVTFQGIVFFVMITTFLYVPPVSRIVPGNELFSRAWPVLVIYDLTFFSLNNEHFNVLFQ